MSPPGIAGADAYFFRSSATIASVVMSRPTIEAASCGAVRTTLVGSIIPLETRSVSSDFAYSSDPGHQPYEGSPLIGDCRIAQRPPSVANSPAASKLCGASGAVTKALVYLRLRSSIFAEARAVSATGS